MVEEELDAFDPFVSVDFEVFGKVQGVYFTKYCRELADHLGLRGWVKNAKTGTIMGRVQGKKEHVDKMVSWLTTTGSPGCKIDKCDLTNWQSLAKFGFSDFSIRF